MDAEAALEDRLVRYAERVFAQSGSTKWPLVRQAARALRVRQSKIQEIVEGSGRRLMLTSYFTVRPEPLGEHYVEVG